MVASQWRGGERDAKFLSAPGNDLSIISVLSCFVALTTLLDGSASRFCAERDFALLVGVLYHSDLPLLPC